MTNESANRWTIGIAAVSAVFAGIAAVCSVIGIALLYTQTPLFLMPPILDWEQIASNTNVKNGDGLYESTLQITVRNLSNRPAKDVTVVVHPLLGKKWTVRSVHGMTMLPDAVEGKAFKIDSIPANTSAQFKCQELVEKFPHGSFWSLGRDKYDIEAGSEEFDYTQHVSAVFTDFGPVKGRDEALNRYKDLVRQSYLPEDYRSEQGKARRAAYLKSKGLKEISRSALTGPDVVPVDTPEPVQYASPSPAGKAGGEN